MRSHGFFFAKESVFLDFAKKILKLKLRTFLILMLLFFLKMSEYFYFISISRETGSVRSVLRKVKLVWP